MSVSVNFSSMSFESGDFVRCVADALEDSGSEGRLLILEMTESGLVHHFKSTTSTLQSLKELGVDVHVDDFGTGYSSLSYMHRLPIAAIKIDQSFTRRLGRDDDAATMIRTIVDLGHSLKRQVVAEGIETREQLRAVRELGCDYGQGFLISRPVDREQAEELVASSPRWASVG